MHLDNLIYNAYYKGKLGIILAQVYIYIRIVQKCLYGQNRKQLNIQ